MKESEIQAAWRGPASCAECPVRELVLFADLQEEDFDAIHLPIDHLVLPAGATLYRTDETAPAIFTVREGLVKLENYLADGSKRIVALATRGDVAGLEALLGPKYDHTAVTLQQTEVCRIPKEIVRRLSYQLSARLMHKWHAAVRNAHICVRDLSTGSARQRVARLFLFLPATDGTNCRLFSREDVGALLGITTETASKTIAALKREGNISEIAPNLFGRDFAGLERIAAGG